MRRRPRAVPWLRDLLVRRRHDREIDRLADVMSCSVAGENRRSNCGCMNRLGDIYRYFIGGAAPTHDSGYYTLTTAQGTSFSLSPNRGADHALPPLRSVASCWVGDQAADNLRYVPYPIRLASSGYKRKAFAYEMLRKSVSLNAG